MSLIERIPKDYQRPKCPRCHQTLSFVHESPGGSRYACTPCEYGIKNRGNPANRRITTSEASWIIRHGVSTPDSRSDTGD